MVVVVGGLVMVDREVCSPLATLELDAVMEGTERVTSELLSGLLLRGALPRATLLWVTTTVRVEVISCVR